jgi:hypothetical protein
MSKRLLATVLALAISAGRAEAQTQSPTPTPIDRLALRGAIVCTWLLSDSPKQYEVFEALRQFFIAVGRHPTGTPITDVEREAVVKQLQSLQLTGFEDSMTASCLVREGEHIVSLIGRPN